MILNEINELADKITALQTELNSLDYLMYPGGIDYTQPQITTSKRDSIAEYEAYKDELTNALEKHQKRYMSLLGASNELLEKLEKTNPIGAVVLREYYISKKTIVEIAELHSYSRDGIYKIRDRAIKQLEEI